MKKKKATADHAPVGVISTEQFERLKAVSMEVSPDALEEFLHRACFDAHAYEFRLKLSREAQDPIGVQKLEAEALPFKKRRAYFEKELADRFPEHKWSQPDYSQLESEIVINDYFNALKLKRDAKIASDAAKALEIETEQKMALQEMQRALRYIGVLEPRVNRLKKAMGKE